jgi:hypothetical protein
MASRNVRTVHVSFQRAEPTGGEIGIGTGVIELELAAGGWLFPDGGAGVGSEPVDGTDGEIVHPDDGSIGIPPYVGIDIGIDVPQFPEAQPPPAGAPIGIPPEHSEQPLPPIAAPES